MYNGCAMLRLDQLEAKTGIFIDSCRYKPQRAFPAAPAKKPLRESYRKGETKSL